MEGITIELLIILFAALVRMLREKRCNIIDWLRLFLLRVLSFFCLSVRIYRSIDRLGLLNRLGFILKEDRNRHKGTILIQNLLHTIFIGKLIAVLVQIQRNLGTTLRTISVLHLKIKTFLRLPVNRSSTLHIRQGINRYLMRYHKCAIEAQTKMTDNLLLASLILVLAKEIGSAGKCDFVDILLYFISRHTDTVINKGKRLFIRIRTNDNLPRVVFRLGKFATKSKLLKLRDCVTAVRNQLTYKNIMVGIQPLLNDRKDIFRIDG